MIKKLSVVIFLLVVIPTAQSFAQTSNSALIERPAAQQPLVQPQQAQTLIGGPTDGIQNRAQAFRERINQIQDAQKKAIVERIVSRITTLNTTITTKFSSALDVMSTFVGTLEQKSQELKARGQDTTALDSAISDAKDAIVNARAAVTEQTTKTYSAEITSDATLRSSIGQMTSTFRQDISEVHALVSDAKDSVITAIQEVRDLSGSNTATDSANIN